MWRMADWKWHITAPSCHTSRSPRRGSAGGGWKILRRGLAGLLLLLRQCRPRGPRRAPGSEHTLSGRIRTIHAPWRRGSTKWSATHPPCRPSLCNTSCLRNHNDLLGPCGTLCNCHICECDSRHNRENLSRRTTIPPVPFRKRQSLNQDNGTWRSYTGLRNHILNTSSPCLILPNRVRFV